MPDTLTIRISATTMEGHGAQDPQVTVTVRGQDILSSYIQQAVIKNFDTPPNNPPTTSPPSI